MKTFKISIAFIIAVITVGVAQESSQTLETVYLKRQSSEIVVNDFSEIHQTISLETDRSFRELLKAADRDGQLSFQDEDHKFIIAERTYLKGLRRSVNNSADASAFVVDLQKRFPEIKALLAKDSNLEAIYNVSRPSSFNGKLDALPSIL